MIIHAPISVGELYDKITILEVKAARFEDPAKLTNVRRELELLRSIAGREVETVVDRAELNRLVEALQQVNDALWDIEDGKRAAETRQAFDEKFIRLAREVYLKNDRRAAIKRAINLLAKSDIVEEKGHAAAGAIV